MHAYPTHTYSRRRKLEGTLKEDGEQRLKQSQLLLTYLKLEARVQLSFVNLADAPEEISYNCNRVRALMYASKNHLRRRKHTHILLSVCMYS